MANGRKKRNTIRGLENDTGIWVMDEDGMKTIALDYFRNLFIASKEKDIE